MTPAARVKTIIEILETFIVSPVPMDSTIGDFMRNRRYIGSKDRRNIVERLYSIARHHGRINWLLEQAKLEDTPRNRVLVWLIWGEKKTLDDMNALFDGSKYGPEALTSEEQALSFDDKDMPAHLRVECPPQYEEQLRALYGDHFEQELNAMLEPATLDIRVNVHLKDVDSVKDVLAKDKVHTDKAPYSPWGLRTKGKVFLSKTKAFVKGWIDIQDEGSQLIATVCNAQPGMQVLDYCAGGGGKTLALANAMGCKGRIVAMDTEEHRLKKARPRFRRSHVHDIIEIRPLSEQRHRKWLRRQKGTFDVVLLDVPCSGTGTWRRNPDTRWRQFGPSIEELTAVQSEILDKVAHTVKPGGRLVYATCSILSQENEDQIKAFLERHKNYMILPLKEAWPEGLDCPCEGELMRLSPYQHNTDGFFAAVLVRKEEETKEKAEENNE